MIGRGWWRVVTWEQLGMKSERMGGRARGVVVIVNARGGGKSEELVEERARGSSSKGWGGYGLGLWEWLGWRAAAPEGSLLKGNTWAGGYRCPC